jgi:hypothetical protein
MLPERLSVVAKSPYHSTSCPGRCLTVPSPPYLFTGGTWRQIDPGVVEAVEM